MVSKTLSEIPIIDFSLFDAGSIETKQIIVDQIYHACHDVGFMYLVNHGISADLVQQVFAESQTFFSFPVSSKQKYSWTNALSNRGYIGVETEQLEPERPADWKEAFSIRQDIPDAPLSQCNKWPDIQPSFRPCMLNLYAACSGLASQVLKAFALALHQPESFFSAHHGNNYTLRLLHYPPAPSELKPNQIRAGAHSDYGCITLLFQDAVGGLEILSADGSWIAAPYVPNAVLINIGDLMQRWTNNKFCSTVHRVVHPNGADSSKSRYSIAFFGHPNPETEIVCIEESRGTYRPAISPPIRAGDHILAQLNAAHVPQLQESGYPATVS